MKPFFDALFSLPKDHIANFEVELIHFRDLNQQDIVDSWRAKSRGQKLKLLNIRTTYVYFGNDNRPPLGLPELFNIASNVSVQ